MASTFLPLRAMAVDRLAVMKVLPLPGSMDVSMITLWAASWPSRNSRLLRTTRKDSFITSRFLSETTTETTFSFFGLHQCFFPPACGISPAKGVRSDFRSFLPWTVVVRKSFMNRTRAGMARPSRMASR